MKPFTRPERLLLLFFAALKLLLHFSTNTNYGLHRDEFLYLDEARHLGWGFLEVPPMTPFLGWLSTSIFGDGVFAVRLFPALIGVGTLYLVFRLVKEFGGGQWAMLLAGAAFLFAPPFLRSNTLFQPVCFIQFFWVLSAFLLVRAVQQKTWQTGSWAWLGIAVGLGWMTKYSIAFFMVALMGGFLVTPQRRWLATWKPWLAVGIAFVIALPNLLWQMKYDFPVWAHMHELASTQLVNMSPASFLGDQLLRFFSATPVWLAGLFFLFASQKMQPFRFLAWGYVFLILLLLALSGKSYYATGAYPMLLAAGGVGIEQFFQKKNKSWRYVLPLLIVLPNLFLLPLGLPILNLENLKKYCAKMAEYGVEQRWEDGKTYPIPQDYADMHGWEEMAAKVAKKYLSLPDPAGCLIWGGGYSHASSLNYFREKYKLPEAFSLNSSYLLWASDSVRFDQMLLVNDVWSDSSGWFFHHEFVDSIADPYAREPGYIFYRKLPRLDVEADLKEVVKEERGERLGQ